MLTKGAFPPNRNQQHVTQRELRGGRGSPTDRRLQKNWRPEAEVGGPEMLRARAGRAPDFLFLREGAPPQKMGRGGVFCFLFFIFLFWVSLETTKITR